MEQHKNYSDPQKRGRLRGWMLTALLFFAALGCNLSGAAPAATPEPIVVVVTATGEPAAPPAPAEPAATTPADTPTPTETLPPADTATPTLTLTFTPSTPTASADKGVDVNCRYGPGPEYAINSYFMQGQTAQAYGRNEWSNWIQIQDPKQAANKCWVDADFISLSVAIDSLAELAAPGGFVYDIKLTLEDGELSGCVLPVTAFANVVIKMSGPGELIYKFESSSGWTSAPLFKIFAAFGSETLSHVPVTVNALGNFWVRAVVTSPNNLSRQVNGKVTC